MITIKALRRTLAVVIVLVFAAPVSAQVHYRLVVTPTPPLAGSPVYLWTQLSGPDFDIEFGEGMELWMRVTRTTGTGPGWFGPIMLDGLSCSRLHPIWFSRTWLPDPAAVGTFRMIAQVWLRVSPSDPYVPVTEPSAPIYFVIQ